MKALIIEDNKITRKQICRILKNLDFRVFEADSGEAGLKITENENIDIIVLDINLLSMCGYSVCYFIRKNPEKHGDPKILMLSERIESKDVVKGFKEGTDDYLRKPFIEEELVFRIMSLLKRSKKPVAKKLTHKSIILDLNNEQLKVDGVNIKVTPKEFKLIEFLINNHGLVVKKEKIYCSVWDRDYFPENKTLDVCLTRIKKKIPIFSEYLKTYKGIGYKFD